MDSVIRSYKFALRHSARADRLFPAVLDALHLLRNDLTHALAENRAEIRATVEAGGTPAEYLTRPDLYLIIKAKRSVDPALRAIHSQVCQNVATRVIEGTKRWLEALRDGRTNVRPPRPVDRKRVKSFTFPQWGNGVFIRKDQVHLSGLGAFRLHLHRKMRGTPKTATIKQMEGRWFCIVTCEMKASDLFDEALHAEKPDAGGDPGLTTLLHDSHDQRYDPPRALRDALKGLQRDQRALSRKFECRKQAHAAARAAGNDVPALREVPYSNRLKRQIQRVAKRHIKVERIRDYHQKKIAAIVSDRYRNFAFESHGLAFMTRNPKHARSASDRAIGSLSGHLASKLGPRFVKTSNRRSGIGGNSQTCLCGASVPKARHERNHACTQCGLEAPRDLVSANIVQAIAFGTIAETLIPHYPAGGQPVVIRGGDYRVFDGGVSRWEP